MKKTIKQLEEQVSELAEAKDRYYRKWQELEELDKKRKQDQMFNSKRENDELANQVRNLLEIIRWHINPETTRSPFMPSKDQRDNEGRNRF